MKRLFASTCLAAVCAVGLSAQSTAQPPAQSPQPKDDKTVTVTGCLRAGDSPGSFVLSNVKWDKGGASSATGTSGSAGAPAAGAAPSGSAPAGDKQIRLTGSPAGTQLSEHVGHTIQVTGKLDPASATSGTSGTGAPPSGAAAPSSRPSGPALDAESVKMVSTSCSGGQ